jgi:acetylornithine deacetylase/succinyl-diaminopimelate desuccinylase-like protein
LAFSYDEEIGCLGAPSMIGEIVRETPKPSAVIVGEPTSMKVVSGHKGIRTFIVEVIGREAHSSLPDHGVSAVSEALKLMNRSSSRWRAKRRAGAMRISHPDDDDRARRWRHGGEYLWRGAASSFGIARPGDAASADAIEARFLRRSREA